MGFFEEKQNLDQNKPKICQRQHKQTNSTMNDNRLEILLNRNKQRLKYDIFIAYRITPHFYCQNSVLKCYLDVTS